MDEPGGPGELDRDRDDRDSGEDFHENVIGGGGPPGEPNPPTPSQGLGGGGDAD